MRVYKSYRGALLVDNLGYIFYLCFFIKLSLVSFMFFYFFSYVKEVIVSKMASTKVLEKKKAFVSELAEKLKKSCVGVVVDYKGIPASEDSALRKQLREAKSDYFVVKNTLLGRAVKLADLSGLEPFLKGSTAVAISEDDYSCAARILNDFSEKNDYFSIKAGFVEGEVINAEKIKELAKIPSKEVLLANLLRALNSPIAGFATVLSGTIRSLAIVINAIAKKQQAAS